MSTQSLKFEKFVQSSLKHVYRAFTNATALREWMCDVATISPTVGGRFYAAWVAGFYAVGEYTHLEAEKSVAFTWLGRGYPGFTSVHVTLSEQDGGVLVALEHEDIGTGGEWDHTKEVIRMGWESGLENLASVLGSGEDLRITMRPMLGILLNDFNEDIAQTLGVPVSQGIRLDGVVEGLGAQAAGLQADDVLVRFAGREIKDYPDLPMALMGKRAGDQVEVVFFRGSQKMTVNMPLSKRPIPEIPDSIASLAKAIESSYAEMQSDLDTLLQDVSEEQASFKPNPKEWSVIEALAHLLQGERYWQARVVELAAGVERWADDYAPNEDRWLHATISAYPTLERISDALRSSFVETCALFANLPDDFVGVKSSYWRLAFEALQTAYHFNTHLEQMRAAISAARAA